PKIIQLARKLGIKIVATNDCHYIRKEDAFAHEVLLCIQTKSHIEDKNRLKFESEHFYFKTQEEMEEAFKEVPEALKNTLEISEKCNVEIDFDKHNLPMFYPPDNKTPEEYLEELVKKGIEEKFDIKTDNFSERNEVVERAKYELNIIKKMGFSSYFLIISDIVNQAKKIGIRVGPGRGSAAGSIVSYILGITEINPLNYNLIFERFLNPERISLPDIDIDFCDKRREEVISYIRERYGKNNVAQIGTYGTMAARAVVRDVGRALGMPYNEVDRLAKLINPAPGTSLKEEVVLNPDVKRAIESDENVKNLFEISLKLEGLARHSSIHAAGIVITEKEVYNYAPLFIGPKGEVATQYEMEWVEKIGLLKVDILGLKTLSVIDDTLNLIKERKGIEIKDFPLDDKKTYQLLSRGESEGVFQLESKGMQNLLREIKPEKFEDIIAVLALYRPGPMKSGMVREYIERKKDPSKVKYDHPLLEPILKSTYGVILYQEQVMQIANKLANFTMGEADHLRKAMGKKIPSEMEKLREKFIKGAKKNGVKTEVAEKIFDQISKFAGYGFNKSHSTGYSLISYQTAYLKANFPLEFMTALLNSEIGNTDKIEEYIKECERLGIWILPPDVCESDGDFKIFSNDIIFGLSAIKNVGSGAIKSIIESREDGIFKSLFDFCERVNLRAVNRKVIESLIKAGAFDYLEIPRSHLFAMIDEAIEHGTKIQKSREKGEVEIFSTPVKPNYANKKLISSLPEWSESRRLAYEKDMLGVYLTGHPVEKYLPFIKMYSTVSISELPKVNNVEITVGGILNNLKRNITRKGERMASGELEGIDGKIEVTFFPETFKRFSSVIRTNNIVFVKGNIQRREDRVKLIANEVISLSDAKEKFSSKIEIQIKLPVEDKEIKRLKEFITKNKGNCSVILTLYGKESGKVKIKANGYGINPEPEVLLTLKNEFPDFKINFGG
ncbi:MAG: DNA polymerase III subunit alpha, partial [Caldiserica bacterium]